MAETEKNISKVKGPVRQVDKNLDDTLEVADGLARPLAYKRLGDE